MARERNGATLSRQHYALGPALNLESPDDLPASHRRRHPDGLVFLVSPRLERAGLAHGFSTRLGSAVTGCGEPFDLSGLHAGEPARPEAVARRLARFQRAIGAPGAALRVPRQVHGARVWEAGDGEAGAAPEADAVVARTPGHLAGVVTADCVPILLSGAKGRRVAAVHAGWRGLVAGVLRASVEALEAEAQGLLAAIGPCIGVAHYEVGPEVASAFAEAGLSEAVCRVPGRRPHLDLKKAARLELESAGLDGAAIDTLPGCTARDRSYFFSHRRDGEPTGRMLAAIAPRA